MRGDPTVVDLVERARGGDQAAWDGIVERYAPLVWSTCRRYGLVGADADDAGATTWLRAVERLGALREPAALPGWLATAAQRECLQFLRKRNRLVPTPDDDDVLVADVGAVPHPDAWLLREERRIALREAFEELSERCRALLAMLFADPPRPYAEIVSSLGTAQGTIGPMRHRCLDQLRRSRALAAFAPEAPTTSDAP